MPSYVELSTQFRKLSPEGRGEYMAEHSHHAIERIATQTNRNVLCYSSAFLQKPEAGGLLTSINHEDINGFMVGLAQCNPQNGLLLILHTPGGLAEAAQTIVEYLRNVFTDIVVAIPTYAMSAGTMIALGCDQIYMDRQSQLGPIDPQMFIGGRYF